MVRKAQHIANELIELSNNPDSREEVRQACLIILNALTNRSLDSDIKQAVSSSRPCQPQTIID